MRSYSIFQSLNRKSRRKFAQEIDLANKRSLNISTDGSTVTLKRRQARPPGCTFLGAKAIATPVNLTQEGINPTELVIDSGSDITLISETCLKNLKNSPKIKTGQKINLIQLTGSASITGYVNLPIIFSTPSGPVRMDVEAYVVKGMTTPLILGNDFADQYDLSLLRHEGKTRLLLGSSQRFVNVENSTSPFWDELGQPFKVRILPISPSDSKCLRTVAHKRQQRLRRKRIHKNSDRYLRSLESVIIPPESIKRVQLSTANLESDDVHYAEKLMNFQHDECYGPPDSIITTKNACLAVTNFSK